MPDLPKGAGLSRFALSARSLQRLDGVHPDLVAVVQRAIEITEIDFTVLEGVRSIERQRKLYASGASKTLNSRHLTGHAVDLAPYVDGAVSWHWPQYYVLEKAVKAAADELGIPIVWGGDWSSFKDGPHWQLPWNEYDKQDTEPRAVHHPDPVEQAPSWLAWFFQRLFKTGG